MKNFKDVPSKIKSIKSKFVEQDSSILELPKEIQLIYTDVTNSGYYIKVTILNGNYSLLLDTASSISWIDNIHNIPVDENSPDFQLLYTGESVTGELMKTDIAWSQFDVLDNLGYTNSNIFQNYSDGVLALSNNSTFINNLYTQNNQKDSAKFGFVVNQNLNLDYGGLMILGSSTEKYLSVFNLTNQIKYTIEPNPNSYWLVNMTLTGNNTSLQAIVDTGTTGIVLPLQQANGLHAQLFRDNYITDNQGNYAFACNHTASFNLTIDSSQFQINSIDFKGNEYQDIPGYCASKIQGIESSNYWILGQTFLKKYYTIFDLTINQISFSEMNGQDYMKLIEQASTSSSSSSVSSLSPVSSISSTLVQSAPTSNSSISSPDQNFNGASNKAGLLFPLNMCIGLVIICICIV